MQSTKAQHFSSKTVGSRRRFLQTSATIAAALLGRAVPSSLAQGGGQPSAGGPSADPGGPPTPHRDGASADQGGCPAEVRAALSGPWPSLRTPFDREGNVDFPAMAKLVDFLLQAKAKAVVLTWGDSLYSILGPDEIADVTRAVVRQVNRRAFVVAADGSWGTRKTVEFAKFCRETGADMLMVKPPDWAGSTTVESLVAHFHAVAEPIPLMLVTGFLGPRGPGFATKAIQALCERVPRLWAVKDDLVNDTTCKMCAATRDRWTWSAGGRKENHLRLLPFGADGYLSTFITFKPEIAWRYWRAIQNKDMGSAEAVIRDYDRPLFEYLMASEGGFDAAIHGIYERFGLTSRFRRAPYHTLTDAQMESLAEFLRRGLR